MMIMFLSLDDLLMEFLDRHIVMVPLPTAEQKVMAFRGRRLGGETHCSGAMLTMLL